jgi:hypothetical protein
LQDGEVSGRRKERQKQSKQKTEFDTAMQIQFPK